MSYFAEKCLVPYLYAVSYKIKNGGDLFFGELAHSSQGVLQDYCELFGVNTKLQVFQVLKLLALKKRIANKMLCPCGCNRKLGSCILHFKLNKFREFISKGCLKEHTAYLMENIS